MLLCQDGNKPFTQLLPCVHERYFAKYKYFRIVEYLNKCTYNLYWYTVIELNKLTLCAGIYWVDVIGCVHDLQTLRRCYSRVKEHGIGKRKSSYTIEQLEKVFGQGGWDSQSCAPVLINSSGLYQEMESDGSTLEDFSQEDWCNQVLDSAFQEGDMETGKQHISIRDLSIVALNSIVCLSPRRCPDLEKPSSADPGRTLRTKPVSSMQPLIRRFVSVI